MRALVPVLLALGLALSAGRAEAALKFGESESIRFVSSVALQGPEGEKLHLARKISMHSFLLPYAVSDDGYVLGIAGDSRRFFPMPQGERLQAIQRDGYLPDPLPPYALGALDLLFGYSLWILLLGCAAYGLYRYLKAARTPAGAAPHAAPAAPLYAGPPIALPMRLLPGRGKTLGLLAVCVAFVLIGVFLAGDDPLMGYLCAGFFGLGIPVFAMNLVPGRTYLELTQEGFTFAALFRKTSTRWRDIDGFVVWKASGNKMVGWRHVPGHTVKGQALARAMAGVHGALPDTYGMKAEELAALMNELTRRSRAA